MSKYIYNVKKKTCSGVLDRKERDKDNDTGLKEGGGIEISTTVLSIYAMHALFRFCILPWFFFGTFESAFASGI